MQKKITLRFSILKKGTGDPYVTASIMACCMTCHTLSENLN